MRPLPVAYACLMPFAAENDARRRKIGTLDELHQVVHFDIVNLVPVLDQVIDRVDQFVQVVRRNVRRHTDRDAGGAVQQKIRNFGGQNARLFHRAVKVLAKVHRVAVNVEQQFLRDFGEARFGVTHRGGGVVVNAAEIALPVNQRIAHRKILRHADERVVHRLIAVRVIAPQHIADDARAFFVRECCGASPSRPSRTGCGAGRASSPSRTSGSARAVMTDIA